MASFPRKTAIMSELKAKTKESFTQQEEDDFTAKWFRLTQTQKQSFIALGVGPLGFSHMFDSLNEYRICYGPKSTVFCIRQKNHASKLKDKRFAEVFLHFKFWVTDKSIEPFGELPFLDACYEIDPLMDFLHDFEFDAELTAKRTQDPDDEIKKLEQKLGALKRMKLASSKTVSENEFNEVPKKKLHTEAPLLSQRLGFAKSSAKFEKKGENEQEEENLE